MVLFSQALNNRFDCMQVLSKFTMLLKLRNIEMIFINSYYSVNPFVPSETFLYPLKTLENLTVF